MSFASYFGKNNVNYTYFQWRYLTTEHFNIYYNQGGRVVADFAAEAAEDAYSQITANYQYFPKDTEPIPIITYQSHNDFEQTNISGASPPESWGGFTEFLKNRVVLPYEGNYEKFRHVIHHELAHAVYLDMQYGRGLGSIISGISQAQIPLWFIEGLAEYESRAGLDPEAEMFLRDAVINDYLPDIQQLDYAGYTGVYKAGQSIIYWIAHRYGEQKVGELLHHLKNLRDFDRGLKAAIGIDRKELSKRWHRWIKEQYWPQVVKMDNPDDFAHRLTNHVEDMCFVNNSPALSPDGRWIAFLSDRSDYFDVYLMSAIDGKVHRRLVRGQRSGEFEELHWLRPGITWSPDGKEIAFCAKAGELDALYTIDVSNGEVKDKYKFEADALFSPSWSPDGGQIALIHVLNGRSDLATVDLETGQLHSITDDLFDEADPSWSPDGKKIVFTSNRDKPEFECNLTPHNTLPEYNYAEFDIFTLDLESNQLTQITDDPYVERTPVWTKEENKIIYVSDITGAYNLYQHNLDTGEFYSMTNLITGAQQPTISYTNNSVAFSCYFNNGYDIFLLHDPFVKQFQSRALETEEIAEIPEPDEADSIKYGYMPTDYTHFVFNREENAKKNKKDSSAAITAETEPEQEDEKEKITRVKNEAGLYPSHEYTMKLKPDQVFLNAAYSPYYQMQGSGMISFSDVLSNHLLYVSIDLNRSIEWSNFYLNYEYLARRIPVSAGFFQYASLYPTSRVYWHDRSIGLFAAMKYPLNRFDRFEFGASYLTVKRKVLDYDDYYYHGRQKPSGSSRQTIMPYIGYVHDTTIWNYGIAPTNGSRYRFKLSGSPDIFGDEEKSLEFYTFSFDYRKYINYKKKYTFGFRLSSGISSGRNPQTFYLGGVMNWFNPRWDNPETDARVDDIEDIYFSSFATPLRGVGYYNRTGNAYVLGNAEFRFPFIRHLLFGWPLPAYFNNVRGALFFDIGSAWKPERDDKLYPELWSKGFGFGVRLDLGIFPIEWDVAWSPDPSSNMQPRYYFSINSGF